LDLKSLTAPDLVILNPALTIVVCTLAGIALGDEKNTRLNITQFGAVTG